MKRFSRRQTLSTGSKRRENKRRSRNVNGDYIVTVKTLSINKRRFKGSEREFLLDLGPNK